MRITVLGCGSSGGVPQLGVRGGDWGRCDPTEPRNRRLRPSVLVEFGGRTVLIDTSPDLRQQALAADITRIDAILYTHDHADHTHGIDDLRFINFAMNSRIPVYSTPEVLAGIQQRFGYAFEPLKGDMVYKPCLDAVPVDGPFDLFGQTVQPFDQDHGWSRTLGLRIGRFAYSTDVVDLPEESFEALAGVDVWIVDCLRETPHTTHSHLAKTLAWIERVKPKHAVLTHMNVSLDYRTLAKRLPPGVEPGYDGLTIDLPD